MLAVWVLARFTSSRQLRGSPVASGELSKANEVERQQGKVQDRDRMVAPEQAVADEQDIGRKGGDAHRQHALLREGDQRHQCSAVAKDVCRTDVSHRLTPGQYQPDEVRSFLAWASRHRMGPRLAGSRLVAL